MRIVVAREAGGWGDVLCTLFAVRGLRLQHPGAEICYYAMPPFDAFLRGVPDINRVLALGYDDGDPPHRVRLVRRRPMGTPFDPAAAGLRLAYDLVVDLWCPADAHERETDGRVEQSRIDSFCLAAGVAPPPVPALAFADDERRLAEQMWCAICPGADRRVLIQLRAARVTKSWPLAHAEVLGARLKAAGHGVLSVKVDGPSASRIPSLHGLSHRRVAALASAADCIVAPDSALFHVAGFVDRPCVALFGPTAPDPFRPHYPRARFLWRPDVARCRGAVCRPPCFYYESRGFPPPRACAEEGACMDAISPDSVFAAVQAALQES